MAMDAGDAGCTHGLSQRIYNAWTTDVNNGFSSPLSAAQQTLIKSQCFAIAAAVVAEIQANATVVIKTTDNFLQRDNTAGNPPTLAPTANVTLPGGAIQ